MPFDAQILKPWSFLPGEKLSFPHIGEKPENKVDSLRNDCTLCQTLIVFLTKGLSVRRFNFLTGAEYQ